MKTILATLAAVGALTAVAAPAAAQPYGYDRYEHSDRYDRYDRSDHGRYDRRWGDNRNLGRIALERVGRAIENGSLSPWEARRLKAQAYDLYQLNSRIGGNGLDWRERQLIERRYNRLMADLRAAQGDRDYGYGYGYRR